MSEAHNGQFKKGFDIRRQDKRRQVIYKGMTIADLAGQHSNDCVRVLAALMNGIDPLDPMGERNIKIASASKIKAASILLAYAHGKPVDQIKIQQSLGNSEGLQALSTNQLLTIIKQSDTAEAIDAS